MLYGISPGPREAKAEGLVSFQQDYVTDLLMLWRYGIIIKTKLYPHGMQSFYTIVSI